MFLAAGLTAAPLGYNHGLEAGELPLLAEIPIFFCTVVVTLQFLTTIGRRLNPALYVALWYVMAGSSLLVVLNSQRLEQLPGPSCPSTQRAAVICGRATGDRATAHRASPTIKAEA